MGRYAVCRTGLGIGLIVILALLTQLRYDWFLSTPPVLASPLAAPYDCTF